MKRVIILGSTGSIGRAALEVIAGARDEFAVLGLGARSDVDTLLQQVGQFRPQVVALTDPDAAARFRAAAPPRLPVLAGPDALRELAMWGDAALVLVAVVGAAGVLPTLEALRAGRDVALANKETLVAAGAIVMDAARRSGRRVLPIDSEHVAIAQCLRGESAASVRRVLLTGSGGPFLRRPPDTLGAVRPEEALAHPTWRMGKKITVDSATLMNKGLEVIEAHWLFALSAAQIEVVIHPQSIVHSMVEFVDGSIKAQLSVPDMRMVIAYTLRAPDRLPYAAPPLGWDRLQMTFERPDPARYPCLGLAHRALAAGGTLPAVMNAANEVAVAEFLAGRRRFTDIASTVEAVMTAHRVVTRPAVEDILAADAWARTQALAPRFVDPARRGDTGYMR